MSDNSYDRPSGSQSEKSDTSNSGDTLHGGKGGRRGRGGRGRGSSSIGRLVSLVAVGVFALVWNSQMTTAGTDRG